MGYELLCAKIYTPYLGASIYVWTSILSITLLGLAIGYWLGGRLIEWNNKKTLFSMLFLCAALIFSSTTISETIFPSFINIEIRTASLLSGFFILFFPVMLLGTVSPLLINLLKNKKTSLAKASGTIFGIGTLGGIVFVLLTVFILIPGHGVVMSSYILGLCLIVASCLSLFIKTLKDE